MIIPYSQKNTIRGYAIYNLSNLVINMKNYTGNKMSIYVSDNTLKDTINELIE